MSTVARMLPGNRHVVARIGPSPDDLLDWRGVAAMLWPSEQLATVDNKRIWLLVNKGTKVAGCDKRIRLVATATVSGQRFRREDVEAFITALQLAHASGIDDKNTIDPREAIGMLDHRTVISRDARARAAAAVKRANRAEADQRALARCRPEEIGTYPEVHRTSGMRTGRAVIPPEDRGEIVGQIGTRLDVRG
jgi:hypothetical protein